MYASLTDEQLATLLGQGDAAAFTELYDRYHARVYGYLFTMVKVPESAEDLVHEVFMKLWEHRANLVIRSSFSAYLFKTCHNKGVDALRKVAADRRQLTLLVEHYETIASDEHAPTADYDSLMEQGLASLTPQRRAVYRLCKYEGKTYREAAEQLGLSPHTVKEHLQNAVADLKQFIRLHKGELALLFFLWSTPPVS